MLQTFIYTYISSSNFSWLNLISVTAYKIDKSISLCNVLRNKSLLLPSTLEEKNLSQAHSMPLCHTASKLASRCVSVPPNVFPSFQLLLSSFQNEKTLELKAGSLQLITKELEKCTWNIYTILKMPQKQIVLYFNNYLNFDPAEASKRKIVFVHLILSQQAC